MKLAEFGVRNSPKTPGIRADDADADGSFGSMRKLPSLDHC